MRKCEYPPEGHFVADDVSFHKLEICEWCMDEVQDRSSDEQQLLKGIRDIIDAWQADPYCSAIELVDIAERSIKGTRWEKTDEG